MQFDDWNKRFGLEEHLRIQNQFERLASSGIDQLRQDSQLADLVASVNRTASNYTGDYSATQSAAKQIENLTKGFNPIDTRSMCAVDTGNLHRSFAPSALDLAARLAES